jgi:hypothetical protein
MVMTMKMSLPIMILFVFAQLAIAQPGGKPHKVTTYDYHDYSNSNIQKKTFNRYHQGDPNTLIIEEWSFERSNGQVKRTEVRSDGGCLINKFQSTPSTFLWTHNNSCTVDSYDPLAVTETIEREFDPPATSFTSSMTPGIAWGSGAVMHITEPYVSDWDQYYVEKKEVLGLEDVTVTAGTYNDCLKVHRVFAMSTNHISRIEWICPNIGLVKRIQGGNRLMELKEVIYNE